MPAPFLAAVPCEAAPQALTRDQIYAQAVQERLAGDAPAAIRDLQELLAQDPQDVDARLELGLALRASGKTEEAVRELREVLRQAPDYKDARLALADIAIAQGDGAGAKAALGPDLLHAQNDLETSDLLKRLAEIKTGPNWRLDATAALSDLTNGLSDWNEEDVSLSRKVGKDWALTGRAQFIEQFNLHETYLEGEVDHGWPGGEWSLAFGGSLNPTFRPEAALLGNLLLIPTRGSQWRIALSANLSHYVAGDVVTVRAGADRYIYTARGLVGARVIETRDETGRYLGGYSVNGSWRFNDTFEASASYTDAAESDTGMTTGVKTVSVAGAVNLNERTSLQPSITREARDGSYDRLEYAVGVTVRF